MSPFLGVGFSLVIDGEVGFIFGRVCLFVGVTGTMGGLSDFSGVASVSLRIDVVRARICLGAKNEKPQIEQVRIITHFILIVIYGRWYWNLTNIFRGCVFMVIRELNQVKG